MPWPTASGLNIMLEGEGDWVPASHLTDTTVHAVAANLEKTAGKGAADGYAGLDSGSKVPAVNLGGSGASGTNFLRGDRTWQTIAGGGDMLKSTYDPDTDGVIALAQLDTGVSQFKQANHDALPNPHHSNANDPSAGEKLALPGTSGTPSGTNKYVTDADPRNSDARTPVAHNQDASTINAGVLDGDRLPAMSATKKGAVPLTGTPSGLYLKDDSTWGTPAPAAHALGGASHNADTLANVQLKISDADVVAFAGQIGGTAASPDVRGLRESGGQLLTMGAVADTQYLQRSGTNIIGNTPGGGSSPAWKGAIAAAWGDGDPAPALRHMTAAGVASPTPTNITITVARCSFFRLDTALVLNKFRFYGVGATTGIYRVAIYPAVAGQAKLVGVDDFNTALAAWGSAGSALNVTLAANTLYLLAVAVDATGTTPGILALSPTTAATTGVMKLPTGWPGNLDFDAASPKVSPFGFCQFAVTTGALPATLPTLVNGAAWTGGMPAMFLDNSNA